MSVKRYCIDWVSKEEVPDGEFMFYAEHAVVVAWLRKVIAARDSEVTQLEAENAELKGNLEAGARDYCSLMDRYDEAFRENAELKAKIKEMEASAGNSSAMKPGTGHPMERFYPNDNSC